MSVGSSWSKTSLLSLLFPSVTEECCEGYRPHSPGIQQKEMESPGKLTLKAIGIWLQSVHRTGGNRNSWRAQTKLCVHQEPGERTSGATEAEPGLPVSVWGSPAGAWVSSGQPLGQGHWQQQSWEVCAGVSPWEGSLEPYRRACRLQGQTTNREGAEPHQSADNWIRDLLSMALPE